MGSRPSTSRVRRARRRWHVVLVALTTACSRPEATPKKQPPPAASADAAPSLFVNASIRCSECHETIVEEWKSSGHARADGSALYRSMLRKGADVKECSRCHAPLAAFVGAKDPAALEGVTCDACHAIRDVGGGTNGGSFTLQLDDNRKYGPLCDARDHYFHRMGCSTLHTKSAFCSACHAYEPHIGGAAGAAREGGAGETLPVFTEYQEWRDGPQGAVGIECQDCHMPSVRREVAAGTHERGTASHHAGIDSALRRDALSSRATVARRDGGLDVEVVVENKGAAHKVPAGLPGRRVVLRVCVVGADGKELDRQEREYGRILADLAGKEAFFFDAKRELSDTRLAPNEHRQEHFRIDAPAASGRELVLELVWQELGPALSKAVALDAKEELLLVSHVPLAKVTGTREARTMTAP